MEEFMTAPSAIEAKLNNLQSLLEKQKGEKQIQEKEEPSRRKRIKNSRLVSN
jgi:hypothetical protein